MINNDVLSQLQFLIKTSAPPLLEVAQQELELPQLVPGEKVPAHVLANLPNGRFQVLVADKSLDMNLPRNTQPGDTVDLVVVSNQPRLTFALARDLGDVAGTAKPQVSLSETARFLGGLLEVAAQPQTSKGAAGVVQTAPLLSGAPAGTADFAQVLRGALTHSGLFYESHQAQWVTGQRPLSDLLREPQGRLSPAAANLAAAQSGGPTGPSRTDSGAPASQLAAHAGSPVPVQGEKTAPHATTNTTPPPGAESLAKPGSPQPAHPDTLPIVRQQLDALDSRQVMWQGQVWPGQTMEWQVEEREARRGGGESDAPEWQTSLHLVLPQLGEVSARLTLHPLGLRVQINARDPAAAALMAEKRGALQQGMEASGLNLVEMKVGRGSAG